MKNRSVYRGFMLAAGFLASLVIMLSNTYLPVVVKEQKKVATEQRDEPADKVILTVPSHAMPQGSVVRVDEQVPESILEILGEPQHRQQVFPRIVSVCSSLFKTLFRVIIAPNAP